MGPIALARRCDPTTFTPMLAMAGGRAYQLVAGQLLDAVGQVLPIQEPVLAAAGLGDELWCVGSGPEGWHVERRGADGRATSRVPLPAQSTPPRVAACRVSNHGLIVQADDVYLVTADHVRCLGPAARDLVLPVATVRGMAWAIRRGRCIALRTDGGERPLPVPMDLAGSGLIAGGAQLSDDHLAIEIRGSTGHQIVVLDLAQRSAPLRLRLDHIDQVAFIEERAQAVFVHDRNELVVVDLRSGRRVGGTRLNGTIRALATDACGTSVTALLDVAGSVRMVEVGGGALPVRAARPALSGPLPPGDDAGVAQPVAEDTPASVGVPEEAPTGVEPDHAPETPVDDPLDVIPSLVGLAPRRHSRSPLPDHVIDAYLGDTFALIASFCRTAIAAGWDSGRLGQPDADQPPFAREVAAILDAPAGLASQRLQAAREQEAAASDRFARWQRSGLPHVELAADLELSATATTILLLASAPLIWGELARIYALVANDRSRPLVDELLLGQLLEAGPSLRAAIARELDPGSALCRSGAIEVGPGQRPFAALRVHPVVARRLAGDPFDDGDEPGLRVRAAECGLGAIRAPRGPIGELIRALAGSDGNSRVVVRGRSGSGRRTLAAALATEAGRTLALIEPAPTGLGAAADEDHLRRALQGAALRGWLPCVTVDDLGDEPGAGDRLRAILDAHPGPLFLRVSAAGPPALSPGYLEVELPRLSEAHRLEAWRELLEARGLPAGAAAALAARFDVGPGLMARAVDRLRSDDPRVTSGDVEAPLVEALRQHRAGRLGRIATRIDRLASWDDLVLPDDLRDSLQELIGRVRHRRTVLEQWGMERIITSGRAITALFQGLPGTGKTMAAGVVARELGYELWRVDLSQVMSRWLGETEKNLGAVFDAAEDGDVVLLFDEADSLFGKRTEVKSSHDRYANVEINYLLQRLDSFEGLAILTTNFGTAIDPAFRRRLSVQLQFPFPDEGERQRLWRAHLPGSLPVSGTLDLAELARAHQLSGGRIRNAALRASFAAAAGNGRITAARLARAIEREYHDTGRIDDSGRLS